METLMMVTILEIGVFLLGIAVGFIIARAIPLSRKSKSLNCGEIIVNTTDPKKDVLKFALDVPIVDLMNANSVTFQVIKEDSI